MKSLQEHSRQVADRAYARNLDQTGWARGNFTAATFPSTPYEEAIVMLCDGINWYVNAYAKVQGQDDSEMDYLTGDWVGTVIDGVRGMLNGDLGRLDGGTVDAWLLYVAEQIGYDCDTSEWTGVKE